MCWGCFTGEYIAKNPNFWPPTKNPKNPCFWPQMAKKSLFSWEPALETLNSQALVNILPKIRIFCPNQKSQKSQKSLFLAPKYCFLAKKGRKWPQMAKKIHFWPPPLPTRVSGIIFTSAKYRCISNVHKSFQ